MVPPAPRAGRAGDAGHVEPGPRRSAGDAIGVADQQRGRVRGGAGARSVTPARPDAGDRAGPTGAAWAGSAARRSAEHTSDLKSLIRISYAVFCLTRTYA